MNDRTRRLIVRIQRRQEEGINRMLIEWHRMMGAASGMEIPIASDIFRLGPGPQDAPNREPTDAD